jgi:signal transduction histidine kinase/tetratricopeptide (TPR) repeat protein
MRLRVIIFFHIILFNITDAQTSLDSLSTTFSHLNDTTQIKTLKNLCWEYRSSNPQMAINYGSLALSKMETISDYTHYSETNNFLGVIHGNLGELDSAFNHYKLAINFAKKNNDLSQIAYSLNNIGDFYYKSALFSVALENIFHAYEIFEQIGDERGMAYALNDIGEIYLKQNDYQKALDYFLQSGEIRLRINDIRGYAKSLLNLAAVYFKQEMDEIALDTYKKARLYSKKANYFKGESWVLAGISDIYMRQGLFDKALDDRFKSLRIDLEISNKYGEIINYNQIGSIYLTKGLKLKAEEYLIKALQESERTGYLDQQLKSYDLLRQLYFKSDQLSIAYRYFESYETIKDSIYSQESANKIADLQTAFISERKDRENEILRKDVEFGQKNNTYLLIISLLVSGAVFLFISKFRLEKRANNLLNEANQKLSELNAQKDKMFSIIGHDLKNPAATIQNILNVLIEDYIELEEVEKKQLLQSALTSSQRHTKLLLELLEWGNLSSGLIDVEIIELKLNDIVLQLVELLSPSAKEKNIDIEYNIENDIVFSDKHMINAVLRNLVSNSIKFTQHGGKITISDYQDDQFHYISTKDNGVGIETNKIDELFRIDKVVTSIGTAGESGTGLGLLIANEFVKKCGGEILVKSKLSEGSEFIIKLPKKSNSTSKLLI